MCGYPMMPGLRVNLGDLRPLKPYARHQSLLAEDEGVDVAPARGRREALPRAFIHDHNARTETNLPSLTVVQILQRFFIHEEQDIAERLHTGLKTVRRRHSTVIAGF